MNRTVLRCAVLVGAMILGACEGVAPEEEGRLASVRLELETYTDTGNVFQLQNAVFVLSGPVTKSVTSDGLGPYVEVDVPPGDYQIQLKKGWTLAHTSGPGEKLDTSGAKLVSPNPLPVNVPPGVVTDVVFLFALGKEPLGQNDGRVHIAIAVDEPLCGNGLLDPGEECDSALSTPDAPCDELCTGGDTICSQDQDCASAICKQGACPECDADAFACSEACSSQNAGCKAGCEGPALACDGACEAGDSSCRDTCGALSAACWAGCWFDPIGCALTCEPARDLCMGACDADLDACDLSCTSGFASCSSGCASDKAGCIAGCESGQTACWDGCTRCVPCTVAGQCPLL